MTIHRDPRARLLALVLALALGAREAAAPRHDLETLRLPASSARTRRAGTVWHPPSRLR